MDFSFKADGGTDGKSEQQDGEDDHDDPKRRYDVPTVVFRDLAEKNMRHLAKSGYTFYLDDFGVGYSNFNCILRLPLKTVKLDISLTSTIESSLKSDLVSILTDLFHDMGLGVVAEGAETIEQVEQLRAFGVDGIQGYYFAKPMPLAKLRTFMKNNKFSK